MNDSRHGSGRTRRGAIVRLLAALAALTLGAAACSSGPPPPDEGGPAYVARTEAFRAAKDQAFRASDNPDSPIPLTQRATFPGLVYFPINPAYHVPASLRVEQSNPPIIILMATSKDQPRRMQRVGTLRFSLAGTPYTLSAFVEEGESLDRLFVPFGDLTNGGETYHAGRDLELDRTPTGLYDLDFNMAFHPYCLYNSNYDCPIPPAENRLPIAIRAGERLPQ
jgi:hypothetical protein